MASAGQSRRACVLVLDDDPHCAEMLTAFLTHAGHRATMVSDGKAALSALSTERYDLAVLDVMMPDIDGIALARLLHEQQRDLPVIFVSGAGSLDHVIGALRERAFDFLRKPVDLHELGQSVEAALAARRGREHTQLRRDELARRLAQVRRLRHQALHDALTGLPNRALFNDRLQSALIRAHRRQESVAVVFLDLDGFKAVNDRFGHATGDALLKEFAQRLQAAVRAADTVARLGGDEFVAVLPDLPDAGAVPRIVQTMTQCCARPFMIIEQAIRLRCSAGYAVFPQHGGSVDTLIAHADTAMYADKIRSEHR